MLLILDEIAQLGHMPALEQGLTQLRGYGLKMATIWQSMAQLKSVFKDREGVLLDNTAQIYFATQSYSTADYVSKSLGDRTELLDSYSESDSRSWQHGSMEADRAGVNSSRSSNRQWSVHGRALLQPAEVIQLDPDCIVSLVNGVRPILCRRLKWYQEPGLNPAARARKPSPVWWLLVVAAIALIAWSLLGP